MLPIACPESGSILHRACGNQRVTQPDAMALAVSPKIVARLPACLAVGMNADERLEEPSQ